MKQKMTVNELLARYAAGERNFSEIRLSYIPDRTLREVNLSRANFSKGELGHDRLEKVNLSRANLSEVDLSFTGFINCDFSGANLDGSILCGERTWMEGCNCDNASFRNAIMLMVNIENCTFRNAIFDDSEWGGDSGLSDVDLTGASFINSNLFNNSGFLTVARGGKIIFPDGKEVIFSVP
jgi:uncharacterized protein YjbI with pentapeptide repeats